MPSTDPKPTRPTALQAALLNRVTAVVVTFNSAHCVAPLAAGLAGLQHVVVVDNASSDDTLARLSREWPVAQVLTNERNLGFGAANNRGIAAAQTEFVLLINPDCTLDAATVAGLVSCADRFETASAIGPELINAHGGPEATYRWMTPAWTSRGPGADGPACVGFISGACMLVRTSALRKIGGFDESFFLYYEDDDLCIRLHRHCGPLIVEPTQRVHHRSRGSVAGPKRMQAEYLRGFHHIQSKFRFHQKHQHAAMPALRRFRYLAGAVAETGLRMLLLDRKRTARVWGRVMGVLRYRPDPRPAADKP